MTRKSLIVAASFLCVACAACGDDDVGAVDARVEDGSPPPPDAATVDGGPVDAAAMDGGLMDAGPGPDGAVTGTLSEEYPEDVGMDSDPSVVWFEDFEEGSLSAIATRYDQVRDNGGWELISDTPNGSGEALALHAAVGEAVDLYKQLPGHEEWWVRWYVQYDPGVSWHHNGMWIGGYNPPTAWPNPQAGNQPNGDDRFSIAVEPMGDSGRLDFYNYWMHMRSWESPPSTYWGNTLVHQTGFTADGGSWICLELHVRLNPDPASAAGGVLEVWKNDVLVQRFDESSPLGYWTADKFCPEGADGPECTSYPAPATEILNLQQRSTTNLQLNHFWPQNYDADGTVIFDQMVVATRRVGCMR